MAAFGAWFGIVWSMASERLPSSLRTLMILRLPLGSASRKRFFPAGSVKPGSVTGALNVK